MKCDTNGYIITDLGEIQTISLEATKSSYKY